MVIVLIAVLLPVALIFVLAKSASLRGPAAPGRESRRRVDSLVTEAIPEEVPEDDRPVPGTEDDRDRGPYSGPPY